MLLDESCGGGTCGVLLKAGRAMEASNLMSLKQVQQRRLLHRHAARRRHHNGSRRLRRLRREALRAARRHVRCLFPMRQRLLSACPCRVYANTAHWGGCIILNGRAPPIRIFDLNRICGLH